MGRYLFLALIVVIISAGVTYSILSLGNLIPEIRGEEKQISIKESENSLTDLNFLNRILRPEEIEVGDKNEEVVNQLVLERYYTYCEHTVTEKINENSPLMILSKDELLGLYSGWKVKEDLGGRLILHSEIDDFCPKDMAKRYVGEKGGFVAIFYGEPGMKEKVYRVTDIPVKDLPLQIKAQLEKGIKSESEDHLISIIEGLAVYYDE
ncbi:hypothetical protein BBF96_06775 [Anoxybacter fermentans]|uniref:Bypass of forespore C C-terminal domain-containing protein n=1 Tax=Anoxybacter fermentans TaxID=1323375 RepID=A0A3Q9HQ22_9FIRM|nr:BofC C-terminal domain-containing protein [Anoxybacter fermentans]AZR73113.1 hypothetical protein BBF96_06775 [Anoxybacter fermentans]